MDRQRRRFEGAGDGNVLSPGPLCLAFGRAEAGSVVPWAVCVCCVHVCCGVHFHMGSWC